MAPIQLWTVEALNRAFTATWEGRANARKNRLRAFAISTQSPDNRLMTPAANVERIAPNDAQRHGGGKNLDRRIADSGPVPPWSPIQGLTAERAPRCCRIARDYRLSRIFAIAKTAGAPCISLAPRLSSPPGSRKRAVPVHQRGALRTAQSGRPSPPAEGRGGMNAKPGRPPA